MSATWPDNFDPAAWSRKGGAFGGEIPLKNLARLVELLAKSEGTAKFEFEFGQSPNRWPGSVLTVEAEVWLQCQRTLKPYREKIKRQTELTFVASEDQLAKVDDDREVILAEENVARTREIVEEELLLAIPLVPVSESDSRSDWVHLEDDPSSDEKPNPFAMLAALKDKK